MPCDEMSGYTRLTSGHYSDLRLPWYPRQTSTIMSEITPEESCVSSSHRVAFKSLAVCE